MAPDVQKVLNRFESYTRVLDYNDRYDPTGYEWNGVLYVGPNYLNTARQLSDVRKTAIVAYMEESGGKSYADALVYERVAAECDLIRTGILEGFEPADRPDLMLDERPIEGRRVKKRAGTATALFSSLPDPATPTKPLPDNGVELFPSKMADRQLIDSLAL